MKVPAMPMTPSELIEHVERYPGDYYVVNKNTLIKSTFDLYHFIATLRTCHWDFVDFDHKTIFLAVNGARDLMWGVFDLKTNRPATSLICASTSRFAPSTYIFSRQHIDELIKKMQRA